MSYDCLICAEYKSCFIIHTIYTGYNYYSKDNTINTANLFITLRKTMESYEINCFLYLVSTFVPAITGLVARG